jgi:hypothetical protein
MCAGCCETPCILANQKAGILLIQYVHVFRGNRSLFIRIKTELQTNGINEEN